MDFTVKLTNEEQRAVYMRALMNSERRLINLLVMEGYDPDEFDPSTFQAREGHRIGTLRQGDVEISIVLEAIDKIKKKLSSLDE